eukprot:scaffold751_cov395-Prasinococcus_capsulatus_cf.AAC.34
MNVATASTSSMSTNMLSCTVLSAARGALVHADSAINIKDPCDKSPVAGHVVRVHAYGSLCARTGERIQLRRNMSVYRGNYCYCRRGWPANKSPKKLSDAGSTSLFGLAVLANVPAPAKESSLGGDGFWAYEVVDAMVLPPLAVKTF